MIKVGIKGVFTTRVTESNIAKTMKSGELDVFATPALAAAMEAAAVNALEGKLDEGDSSVGGRIDVKHTAPSVIGAEVTAEAELIFTDGKKLVFKVTAKDNNGIIGEAEHERFIVNKAKFMSKAIIRSESNAK